MSRQSLGRVFNSSNKCGVNECGSNSQHLTSQAGELSKDVIVVRVCVSDLHELAWSNFDIDNVLFLTGGNELFFSCLPNQASLITKLLVKTCLGNLNNFWGLILVKICEKWSGKVDGLWVIM